MAHTPGPWPRLDADSSWRRALVSKKHDDADDEAKANYKLALHAPQLLAALQDVVRALDDASSVVDKSDGEEYAYQAELEAARATIKKATGES